MAIVNPGDSPKDLPQKPTEALTKPENNAEISINFTPKIPVTDATPAAPPAIVTKPSTAWSGSLDVPADKKVDGKTETAKATGEKQADFFSSAALQEKSGSSKLIENIASQKAKLEEPKIEELLGKKSTILESSIEQEAIYKMKKKLRVAQFLAFFVAAVAVAVNGFLYFQLSPGINLLGFQYNFESNLRNDLFNLNENLRSMQTELSTYQFLSGQLYLNQFGYESTRFMDSVAKLEEAGTAGDRTVLTSVIEEALRQMPVLLTGAKENLTKPLMVATYTTRGEEAQDELMKELDAQNALRRAISEEKTSFIKAGADNGLANGTAELAFYDNTIKLVGNSRLVDLLNSTTVEDFRQQAEDYFNNNDPAQRLSFRTHIDNLLASTKVNLATITNLRNSRIKWSEVIERLENITNQVNTEHNSGGGSGNASVILYSSYDFNSDTGSIGINAVNSTRSGTNREVVTYLIEALELSPEFKNVSNRNFPLSRTVDSSGVQTYTMSFKIDMELERGAFSRNNSPIENLQDGQRVATVKVPVKRN
jgi:hypothetical protein